jgi:phage gp16-like protein
MTPKARNAMIAKIHIGKEQVGMSDYDYRKALFEIGGCRPPRGKVASSTLLTAAGLEAMVAHLTSLGAEFKRPAHAGKKPRMVPDLQELLNKVDAYLAEAGRPMSYADGIAQRMYKIERVAWLNAAQLRGVIAALDKDAKKAGRATG